MKPELDLDENGEVKLQPLTDFLVAPVAAIAVMLRIPPSIAGKTHSMRKKKRNQKATTKQPQSSTIVQKMQRTQLPPPETPIYPVVHKRGWFSRSVTRFWEAIGILSVIVGLLVAYLYFRQDISVDPGISYDPSDPFSQRFDLARAKRIP
jgi:hypothetical protein